MIMTKQITNFYCVIILTTLLLSCAGLTESLEGYNYKTRVKRDGLKIGDLPQIKPPTYLKKGEPKYPSPGWTHCIKYLKADVMWRSIKSVNLKQLQATQFQCSWFIQSEVPGTQLRISFEKMELGHSGNGACTQQFVEIIDIAVGKSQGRFCGDKRIGDYVTVGQKARIDIHGEEKLVEKVRAKGQPPFIISYKIVREPAGFRINQPKKKVKNTVGVSVGDLGKTIYGNKNQPGKHNPNNGEESSTGHRSSLTIWQVAIIIVVCTAFIACVIGVVIKRTIFDKKKKEKYMDIENNQTVLFPGNIDDDDKELPGFTCKASYSSDKKSVTSEEEKLGNKTKTTPKTAGHDTGGRNSPDRIERSLSKPERKSKKTNKTKRHNSHGDVGGKTKTPKESTERIKSISEDLVKKNPTTSANDDKVPDSTTKVPDDTPANRPTKRARHDVEKSEGKKKEEGKPRKSKSHHHKHGDNMDLNKNHVKVKSAHKTKAEVKPKDDVKTNDVSAKKDDVVEDDTPASRAQKRRKTRTAHSSKPETKRPHKSSKEKGNEETKHETKGEKKIDEEHKKQSKTNPNKPSKRRKTVSSAHKKTSASGKRNGAGKGHSGHRHRKPRSKGRKDQKNEHSEGNHKRKTNHTKTEET